MMTLARPLWALALMILPGAVVAECYADYRAKMDNPLRLHYGVIEVEPTPCTRAAAEAQIAARIGVDGWDLLQVVSVFDAAGLDARRVDAGAYFLRY